MDGILSVLDSCNKYGLLRSLKPCAIYLTLAFSSGVPRFFEVMINLPPITLESGGMLAVLTIFDMFVSMPSNSSRFSDKN